MEVGQVANVVDVRVAQDDGVHRLGVERELLVALDRFLPLALIQAAVEQQPRAVDLEQMPGTGRRPDRAVEGELHAGSLAKRLAGGKQNLARREFPAVNKINWFTVALGLTLPLAAPGVCRE